MSGNDRYSTQRAGTTGTTHRERERPVQHTVSGNAGRPADGAVGAARTRPRRRVYRLSHQLRRPADDPSAAGGAAADNPGAAGAAGGAGDAPAPNAPVMGRRSAFEVVASPPADRERRPRPTPPICKQ